MKRIFYSEHFLPNKVYYNFDFQNDFKSKIVRGAQIILEGYRDYTIEDINELSIDLEEVVKDKSYKLQLSVVTPPRRSLLPFCFEVRLYPRPTSA